MQTDFLMFLQKISHPVLDKFFITITNLGSETFYILMISYVFWCINKKLGVKLFVVTMVSTQINSILKNIFKTTRPIHSEGLNSLYTESAPGYSFPSGHTQGAATFWFYLMRKIRNKHFNFIGWTVILLIGFSRLYLRVHWPIDIIGGLFFGIIIVFILDYIIESVMRLKFNYAVTLVLAVALPHLFLIFSTSLNTVKMTALMTGAFLGFLIESKLINFIEKNVFIKQIVKFVIGILVFLGLKEGIKLIFPSQISYDYIRYFILGIWVTLGAPFLFIKLKLSKR